MTVTSVWQSMRSTLTLLALLAALAVLIAPAATAQRTAAAHGCVRGNELWFRTADGVKLVGHRFGGLRPGTKPVVVLAHMSNGSLCEWLPEARRLAGSGSSPSISAATASRRGSNGTAGSGSTSPPR